MRKILISAVLAGAFCLVAAAEPKEEALGVLAKWAKAFSESDVDGIVRLYAADAQFLGTSSKAVAVTHDEVRKYFEQALLSNKPRGATISDRSVAVLSDSVVVIAALDTVTGVREGKSFSFEGRVTFVIAKRGLDWKIVQFHRSAMPN